MAELWTDHGQCIFFCSLLLYSCLLDAKIQPSLLFVLVYKQIPARCRTNTIQICGQHCRPNTGSAKDKMKYKDFQSKFEGSLQYITLMQQTITPLKVKYSVLYAHLLQTCASSKIYIRPFQPYRWFSCYVCSVFHILGPSKKDLSLFVLRKST